jgi:hypothetical protein
LFSAVSSGTGLGTHITLVCLRQTALNYGEQGILFFARLRSISLIYHSFTVFSANSKSAEGNLVGVRPPLPAPLKASTYNFADKPNSRGSFGNMRGPTIQSGSCLRRCGLGVLRGWFRVSEMGVIGRIIGRNDPHGHSANHPRKPEISSPDWMSLRGHGRLQAPWLQSGSPRCGASPPSKASAHQLAWKAANSPTAK